MGELADVPPPHKPQLGEGPATLGSAHVTGIIPEEVAKAGAAPRLHLIDAVGWARHGKEIHQLILRDISGRSLERFEVPTVGDAWVRVFPHPRGHLALFEYTMGQDGALLFAAWAADGKIRCRELLGPDDALCAGFDAEGQHLLLVPYPGGHEAARVLSWPTLDEVGRVYANAVGSERGWGPAGCFAHDGSLLLTIKGEGLFNVRVGVGTGGAERVALRHPDLPHQSAPEPDITAIKSLGGQHYAVRTLHNNTWCTAEWKLN